MSSQRFKKARTSLTRLEDALIEQPPYTEQNETPDSPRPASQRSLNSANQATCGGAFQLARRAARLLGYMAAHLLVLPFVGAIYIYGGVQMRKIPGITPNDANDWKVMTALGAVLQVAFAYPLYCAFEYRTMVVVPRVPAIADWYGGIVIYCVTAFVMIRIAETFYRKAKVRQREMTRLSKSTERSSQAVQVRRQAVEREIQVMRSEAQHPTVYIVIAVLFVSVVEVVAIRVSASAWNTDSHDRRAEFYVASIFWALIFTVINSVMFMGLAAVVFQLRLVDQFTMKRTERDLTDIRDPQLVVMWCEIWQGIILREVNTNPVTKSLAFWGSAYSLFLSAVSIAYIIMIFVSPGFFPADLQEFKPGAALVLIFSGLSTIGYVAVTVLMQRKIELQHRNVATVSHKLQIRIDDIRSGRIPHDPDDMELLKGKARVIHSLDRLLLTADPKARIFSVSLESLRWIAVNVGLVLINVYLAVILYSKCVAKIGSAS